MLRTIRAFWHDQRGIALILVSIMLPAIIGFSLLAIDMSRMNNLHNDLQKGTDALALAAAAELNGRSDAWTRAENALSNLVANNTMFSDGGNSGFVSLTTGNGATTVDTTYAACRSKGQVSWCFLASIPTNDSDPITSSNYAASASVTRFIQVRAQPETFSAIFPVSISSSGGSTDSSYNVSAVSVAGFTSGVCNYTPVFMCNPFEMVNGTNTAGGVTLEQAVTNPAIHRRLIELRKVGNGAAYGPGNFGFLAPPLDLGHGAQALAQAIATSKPRGCYSAQGVSTKTGQNTGQVQDAFNLRFGIKANGSGFDDPEYGPAENVRMGATSKDWQGKDGTITKDKCVAYNKLTFGDAGTMGLPQDASTPYMSGRMGDGNWDFATYWSTNFGSTSYPSEWDTTKPTRYQVYRYEIANNLVGLASTGGETGTPPSECQPAITTVDRRLIYGALLNCQALEAEGNDLNGNSTNLPVEAFGSFFLTEPVAGANDDASVFVELVDITGRGGQGTLDNFLRDEAQLYR
ncbi:pilus assembly protein TadG-related protein [Mesorhizobium sp. VK22B]|uniref:Pilus assembly protein TadG-related protein n=1 Tax=Mesorhizobium captivum TaxID=3072319 RepID=A0ABU4ZAT6_9HYPH|nr:pilus assembly protein TadG-related protein [Mesorhizobium sp. VK22B]MDX8496393.1 pilus assembly protein TadG-related protein [Mesorhizobium sp. VK22B]